MTDFFTPLFPEENEDTILARLRGWANEGLDPVVDVDQWVDTREGSFWFVAVMPAVREIARLYDLSGTDVPASGFPQWSWGEYLDDLAEVKTLLRLAATPATGTVVFSGADGTFIPAGTTVGVEPPAPDAEAPEFETTVGGTIDISGELSLPIRATEAGSLGNVAPNAITDLFTPIPGVTVTNPLKTEGGTDAESDEGLRGRLLTAYRERIGDGNQADYVGWASGFDGVGRVTVIPLGRGPGTVVVIVSTSDGEAVSQDVLTGLQNYLDPPVFSGTLAGDITLPTGTIAINESTAAARPTGVIRIGDQLVTYTGKTSNSFTGCSGGTGAFDEDDPVTQSGRGAGRAPIGHHVLVLTASLFEVTITADVELDFGYSLDGAGGTIAVLEPATAAERIYIEQVEPGEELIQVQVLARLAETQGVHDVPVSECKINGVAGNVAVPLSPPQAPALVAVTLTVI